MVQTQLYVALAVASMAMSAVATAIDVSERAAQALITPRLCSDTNLSGNCQSLTVNSQTTCFNLADTSLNKEVSSISVPGGTRCRLWSSTVCNGDSTSDIQSPGINNFGDIGFNDQASSFKCYTD